MSLKNYLNLIKDHDLLSPEEEVQLAQKIKDGCEESEARLAECNLRLVVTIAQQFNYGVLPLDDLISAGNEGLLKAVKRFDPVKGAKFSTFAANWIKLKIRQVIYNRSTIRVPGSSQQKMKSIKNARIALGEESYNEVSVQDVAKETGYSEKSIRNLDIASKTISTVSLDSPVRPSHEGEGKNVQCYLVDEIETPFEGLQKSNLIEHMFDLLPTLPHRDRLILTWRFGLDGEKPKTLQQVSDMLGCTRERVRQIQNRALKKLKKELV